MAGLCDLNPLHIDKAAAQMGKFQEKKPKRYDYMMKVFEERSIDAVIIANPG